MIKPSLYIKKTKNKGRAVYTKSRIPANTVVEESPVLVMSSKDREHLNQTLLHDYIFEWGERRVKCCMALGYIPMYNHSYESNCEYHMDYEKEIMTVKTVRTIDKEEELTINYNGDYDNKKEVWFDAK
jgi:uncharacterized protein